jgi:CRISPR/Cas system CSM-associated protein Csm4 (group 5 of RAMP superfamily)
MHSRLCERKAISTKQSYKYLYLFVDICDACLGSRARKLLYLLHERYFLRFYFIVCNIYENNSIILKETKKKHKNTRTLKYKILKFIVNRFRR